MAQERSSSYSLCGLATSLANPSKVEGGNLLVKNEDYLPLRRLEEGKEVVGTLWSQHRNGKYNYNFIKKTSCSFAKALGTLTFFGLKCLNIL